MSNILKLRKTKRRHLAGIMVAIRSGINSAVVEKVKNQIRTTFGSSYGFKTKEYMDAFIYLVAGLLEFTTMY